MSAYAELAAASNFSFLRGASHPGEMVCEAHALGLKAIAIADRNSLAGIVRGHTAAKTLGIQFIPGARLVLREGHEIVCLPTDRAAYGRLCRLLTRGNRRASKGECHLWLDDVIGHGGEQIFIVLPPVSDPDSVAEPLAALRAHFPHAVFLGAALLFDGHDARRLARLSELSQQASAPLVSVGDCLYHAPERKRLQDVLTCIREKCRINEAGYRLSANAERHLKGPPEIQRLYRGYEDAVARTLEIAARCRFSLDELAYEYPDEPYAPYASPHEALAAHTWDGARARYPDGIPEKIKSAVAHELKLIGELDYARYFLTVHDIVKFARSEDILCQGRGSAANSAVCYCLGITSVDTAEIDLLFERFVSAERNEPPDIDVDFEHERREEVIQHIYRKYGRGRVGIAATVVTYRARSAVREVGRALGLSQDAIGALAGTVWGWSRSGVKEDHVREIGLDPGDVNLARVLELTFELIGFPRHLSQHTGGFVITRGRLDEIMPIANAAMAERTYVEWDKDDLSALGMLKIDVLALGMLSCIRKGFDLLKAHYNIVHNLASIPQGDEPTYDMICKADTLGVFQIESRAQMTMLPRLRPRCFYDLVIEVAIVRPGPIQGDMVHPYLRRRQGLEKVDYPTEELREVLEKTLGVPLFQEQAMKLAIVAAGFTPSQADQLRRAMATFRKTGAIQEFRDKLVNGMTARGYEKDFAERCFRQIEGFGEYGFPESHAASFALLVYVSSWMKRHHPDVFACALLNSQPMGFYAPAQIVRDFRDHGGEVRAADINCSAWDYALETPSKESGAGTPMRALRLGFRQIRGFKEDDAEAIMCARSHPFTSIDDFARRTGLSAGALKRLADADAFRSIGLDRRQALWAVSRYQEMETPAECLKGLPLFEVADADPLGKEPEADLPDMKIGEHVIQDYASIRMSLKAHPLQLLRARFAGQGYVRSRALAHLPVGKLVQVAGIVLVRQRPGTASGVIFATIEDETGVANIIIWPKIFERRRRIVMAARLLGVRGRLQREQGVIHVVAEELADLSASLAGLSRGDEARAPQQVLPRGRNFH